MKLRDNQISKIVLQISEFRCIDIFRKGYYQLKARLYAKYKTSSTGYRRVDGEVIRGLSSSYQDLFVLGSSGDAIAGYNTVCGFTASQENCTLPHTLCNWRCNQSALASKKLASTWFSKIFHIEYSNDHLLINETIIFEIEKVCKLYESEYYQQDDIYLDFELFFTENTPMMALTIAGSSIQRCILQIPSHSKTSDYRPLHHQIIFTGIYQSSLDIFVSQILCESRLVLKNENMSSLDISSISSASKYGISTMQSIMSSFLGAIKRRNMITNDEPSTSSLNNNIAQTNTKEVRNICDAIVSQTISMLKIFAALSLYTSDHPLLSKYQLLSDISLPWNDIFPGKSMEIVMDLVPLQMLLERSLIAYFSKNEVDLEFAQKALSSLNLVCVNGAADLLETSIPRTLENVYAYKRQRNIEQRALLDHFVLERNESQYLKYSFELPSNISSNDDLCGPSIIQHFPKPAKKAWMIEIKPENSLLFNQSQSEGKYKVEEEVTGSSNGVHLIVFVHGLLGHSNDLRKLRSEIVQNLNNGNSKGTEYLYFFSKANQDNTFDHLITMGSKLAREIVDYVDTLEGTRIQHLSFIAHSLGGLITRIAIRHELLIPYKAKFHSLITFGTPHLSQALNDHILMSSFLGMYQALYSADCISQLYMKDHDDKRECLLYKLSQDTHLQLFKKGVHVFASEQDKYVHFEGTLLTPLCLFKDYSDFDPALKPIYREMHGSFLSNCASIHRYQLHFEEIDEAKQTWGAAADPLGRMAHIALVTNDNAIALSITKTLFPLHTI